MAEIDKTNFSQGELWKKDGLRDIIATKFEVQAGKMSVAGKTRKWVDL